MFFVKDKFYKQFKNMLNKKNFQIVRKIDEDMYEVSSGTVSFNVDVRDARRDYEYGRNPKTMEILISRLELDFIAKYKLVSFHNAQQSLRTLLMRDEDVLEEYISMDFVEHVKKVMAFTTDDENIYPLDSEYIKKWGVPKDVLFNVSDKNMCDVLRAGNITVSTIAGKIKVIEFSSVSENLRASIMACSSFKKLVSEKLGARFLVVIPSSSSILAVEDVRNDIIETFGPIVVQEYKKAKNKLSTDVFLFDSNGISAAGRFSVPETAVSV